MMLINHNILPMGKRVTFCEWSEAIRYSLSSAHSLSLKGCPRTSLSSYRVPLQGLGVAWKVLRWTSKHLFLPLNPLKGTFDIGTPSGAKGFNNSESTQV